MENVWSGLVNQRIVPTYMNLGISRELVNNHWNNNKTSWIYLLDESSYKKQAPIGKSRLGASLAEIISDRHIESLASYAIGRNRSTNFQSKTLHERISEILTLIDSEIK